jgi:DNA-binding transcriptional LysR family regulator
VVEVGTFAAAARKLGRATSVIGYTMTNLESHLGVTLFERDGTRKPVLTDAGRTVLAEAQAVTNGVDTLKSKVKCLLQGLEAELHLVLDVPGISQKMLTQHLRELEKDRLVQRIDFEEKPLRVEYRLSDKGRRLMPVLIEARRFSANHSA